MKPLWKILLACCLLLPGMGCEESPATAPTFDPSGPEEKPWVPDIVPCLDARPGELDRQGRAEVSPAGPFPVNSTQDFRVTFTAGPAGMSPRGYLLLQISPWWGWSPPQIESPASPGYVEVIPSFTDPPLHTKVLPLNRVLVWAGDDPIPAGSRIEFRYNRARVDRFAEAAELFQVFLDADGDGHAAPLEPSPSVAVAAAAPVRLRVNAPSLARPGPLTISAAPLDPENNWGLFPSGDYLLVRLDASGREEEIGRVRARGGEKTLRFAAELPAPGLYFFRVAGPAGLQGRSNVTWCRERESFLRLYFGDIHGHSRTSDGTGIAEDFYRYAREVSGLDIAVLTDHSDYGTIQVPGRVWEENCRVAAASYDPGSFVTLAGFEWTNWKYGHRNVYYRDGAGPIFRSFDPASDTPGELWDLLSPYEAMTIAHHPGGGPVPVDWSIAPWEREVLVEVSSIHGSSEFYGCERSIYKPVPGAFVRDALSRGYKLGLIGGGDTHDGHPGSRSSGAPLTGLMGVWAEELTREAIWEAMRQRRVYATSGPKIILNFRVGDKPMGSEISWASESGPLPLAWQVIGCEPLERVEIVRNGTVVFARPGEGLFDRGLLEDPAPPPGGAWYYLKAVQADGNLAWSSPVWVAAEI